MFSESVGRALCAPTGAQAAACTLCRDFKHSTDIAQSQEIEPEVSRDYKAEMVANRLIQRERFKNRTREVRTPIKSKTPRLWI